MDLIPLENLEPVDDNTYLSETAKKAREYQIERRLARKSKRETLQEQMEAVHELIGGVPRMALEADKDPFQFYKLHARITIASQVKNVHHSVEIISTALAPSALDTPPPVDADYTDVPSDGQ